MRTWLPGLGLVLFVSACANTVSPYARATAGYIGCPAEDIELSSIERDSSRRGPHAWLALCGRSGYACSSDRDPGTSRARITCSELARRHHGSHRGPRCHHYD